MDAVARTFDFKGFRKCRKYGKKGQINKSKRMKSRKEDSQRGRKFSYARMFQDVARTRIDETSSIAGHIARMQIVERRLRLSGYSDKKIFLPAPADFRPSVSRWAGSLPLERVSRSCRTNPEVCPFRFPSSLPVSPRIPSFPSIRTGPDCFRCLRPPPPSKRSPRSPVS